MAFLSRRNFLSAAGALGFASGVGALSSATAGKSWAASLSGYKAMVCIFLKGGMDHADTILPYDADSYNRLASLREGLFRAYDASNIASSRNRENLLRLNPANAEILRGRELSLPRELSSLHDMFEDGDLAILGNVGPLIEPTLRSQIQANTAILPPRLFSHNDQQSSWMAFGVEGQRKGWGGSFAEAILGASPNLDPDFVSVSATMNDVFLSGDVAIPVRVYSSGTASPHLAHKRKYLGGGVENDEARALIHAHLARSNFNDGNIFAQDIRASNVRAIETSEQLLAARDRLGPFSTEFQKGSFSAQMKSVAETIKLQSYFNTPRQIFYTASGNFDTHNSQANSIGDPHLDLANAIASFKSAMQEIGQWDNVVVFTMSDFGRTLLDNGDGTDHGWGGHHFIAGGQVNGNRLFGEFPPPEPDSEDYTPSRGRLIPTTSVEQYAATIGRWFGLSSVELHTALPNLKNFDLEDLGFMR
ncbi:MAG: DUF1501 domain-containing protein [Pseudomonadota bacterium]